MIKVLEGPPTKPGWYIGWWMSHVWRAEAHLIREGKEGMYSHFDKGLLLTNHKFRHWKWYGPLEEPSP